MADIALDAAEIAHTSAARRWHAAVPTKHHGARLDQFTGDWLSEAYRWAENPQGRNVLIVGPVGAGKSHLAAAMIRDAVFDSLSGAVLEATEILDRLRPNPDGNEYGLDDLVDLERLVVDDLGTERLTDWAVERIGMLISQRWKWDYPTIYTTNLDRDSLSAHVGPRSYSRIVGGSLVIRLSGNDRRRS